MNTNSKHSPTAVLFILTIAVALVFSATALGQEGDASNPKEAKRSVAQVAMDSSTTLSIRNIFFSDIEDKSDFRINVTTINGICLLVGEVPSAEMKDLLHEIAAEQESVRQVVNEVRVGKVIKATKLIKDKYLKAAINVRMAKAKEVTSSHVTVVVSNAVAYLMGILSEQEAHDAANVAANTRGVARVVSIFEIAEN